MQMSGFSLVGFFLAFIVLPLLPEIQCLSHIKEGKLNDISLVDKASGIYSIFFSTGCILAVLVGESFVQFLKVPQN
jgi:hypothetical protein